MLSRNQGTVWPAGLNASPEAGWPRMVAPRCRPGHPLAVVKPGCSARFWPSLGGAHPPCVRHRRRGTAGSTMCERSSPPDARRPGSRRPCAPTPSMSGRPSWRRTTGWARGTTITRCALYLLWHTSVGTAGTWHHNPPLFRFRCLLGRSLISIKPGGVQPILPGLDGSEPQQKLPRGESVGREPRNV